MSEPTLEEILQARDKCAQIVALYGARYLPIFERLEKEVNARLKQQSLLEKAISIANENGTRIGTQIGTQNENLQINVTQKFNEIRYL